MKKKISTEKCVSVLVVAAILVLWFLATTFGWVDDKLIPSPKAVWTAFALAFVTAVPLGLLSGFSAKVRAAFEPIIEFYRPLPPDRKSVV